MKRAILACLALLCLVATAAAQSFPLTLPASTVYGRLGIGTGPGQAIPFSTLGQQLNASLSGGLAKMFPHSGQTTSATDAFTAIDPYGNAITCTGTNSQCLQEFLNTTAANGWPAALYCQGTQFPSKLEPVFVNTTVQITVPVAQDWSFHSYGCNLNVNVTTVAGLVIDSQGASVFDWDGKIVYNVTAPNGDTNSNPSCAVLIQPTSTTGDGFAGLYAKYIRIGSPVVNPVSGTATAAVCVNTASGSTIQETLWFDEINSASKAFYGLLQFGNGATTGFRENTIHIGQVHGFTKYGINLGFNSTNQANNNGNKWEIGACNSVSATGRCFDSFGSNDIIRIGRGDNAEGGLQYLAGFETGANSNSVVYGITNASAAPPWTDSGTCNSITGPQGTSAAAWGQTSGCTKVVPTAAASGTLTLPAATDTIVGRLSTPRGFAVMHPNPSQGAGAWNVIDPFGNAISTSGTTCQGFDKLLAAASTNGWSWAVLGNGTISCTAPISVPTCFLRSGYVDTAVSIAFTAQGSSNLVTFDSHENCDIQWLGQVTQNAADTGAVFDLKPTTNDGAGNTVFAANDIVLSTAVPGTAGIGFKFDLTSGGFIGNTITIHDVNAGATGIQVTNPGSALISFEQNRFFLGYIHGQTTRVLQVGTGTTNQSTMRYNAWHTRRLDPGTGATAAVDTWGRLDSWFGVSIVNETASATTGIVLESGANNNNFFGGHVAATTARSDSGTGNKFWNVDGVTDVNTFATLATCNAALEGMIKAVSDSNTNVWGAAVAGAGANHVLAYCDGTNWTVAGK